MINSTEATDWREARRRSAHDAIIDAAWSLVSEEGLAGLTLRDLAHRAGITAPTVYAYFDSKSAIYDAMFGRAATDFAECMAEPLDCDDARAALITIANRFSDFCTDSPTRYQLLFQRTIPGFEPSPESYAPAMRALVVAQEQLALNGITEARHVDLWTALITGLVDQQVSNDLGGDRWTRLIEESVDMFLTHCRPAHTSRKSASRPARTEGAQQ
jgi:AcrR family transcriptional regulator